LPRIQSCSCNCKKSAVSISVIFVSFEIILLDYNSKSRNWLMLTVISCKAKARFNPREWCPVSLRLKRKSCKTRGCQIPEAKRFGDPRVVGPDWLQTGSGSSNLAQSGFGSIQLMNPDSRQNFWRQIFVLKIKSKSRIYEYYRQCQ
jgi:hypothetical protein